MSSICIARLDRQVSLQSLRSPMAKQTFEITHLIISIQGGMKKGDY